MLWLCEGGEKIWGDWPPSLLLRDINDYNFDYLFCMAIDILYAFDIRLFVIIALSIWLRRNSSLF